MYAQDDWRARPNLTISPGVRFETQTNVNDRADVAPRLSLSWAPGAKPGKASKTVLRGGVGTFYDRFSVNSVLNTIRYSGTGQQNYSVNVTSGTPSALQALSYFGSGLPPVSLLSGLTQTIYEIDPNLKSSYMIQMAGSIESAHCPAVPHSQSM